MEFLHSISNNYIFDAFGWTLIHSLWQITIWAIVAVTILILTHKKRANIRYLLLVFILLGVCTTSVITFKRNLKKEENRITQTALYRDNSSQEKIQTNAPQNIFAFTNDVESQTKLKIQYWFNDYFEKQLPGILTIWFLGFVFLFLRYLGSYIYLLRLKGTATIVPDKYDILIYRLSRKLRLSRIVAIGTSIKINTPVVLGHFKPVLLFPAKLLTKLTDEQLETILLHELAHVKRNDFLVNLMQSFLEVVFFYHPAVWWLSSSIRVEREHACDDLAVQGGAEALNLAEALASLVESFTPYPQYSQAFSGKQHKIKNRIQRLIMHEKMKTNYCKKIIVALVLVISIATLAFTVQHDVKDEPVVKQLPAVQDSTKLLKTEEAAFQKQQKLAESESELQMLSEKKAEEEQEYTSQETRKQQEKAAEIKESSLIQNQSAEAKQNYSGDDDSMAQTLKLLMQKGAKAWNKYRDEHPGENFGEALKESDLSNFDLSNFDLSNINLKEAALVNTNFSNANMFGVNIKEAIVVGAIFENAILSNSDMKELSLEGNNFKNAVIREANLKEISLVNCDLSGVDLSGSNLSEAVIENCKFKGAVANHQTLFPEGFDWAKNGIVLK